MSDSVEIIPILRLGIVFIPVLITIGILLKWSLDAKKALYAITRMVGQLLLIGYFLSYIFQSESSILVIAILIFMVFVSSWIALGTIKPKRLVLYKYALISILIGGGSTLLLVTQGVLNIDPWYAPHFILTLGGMIFANSMNGVSIAAERLNAEIVAGKSYLEARNIALQGALIYITNTLFAVGLVSLPGMMTGQILSGISPLVAARYQIMVMAMLFGTMGIASSCFLILVRPFFDKHSMLPKEHQ